ncbi:MAG: hypothetical protein CTY34_12805 [Methylobacter sp.]|nr:MAG: hypothetical protein CTY34_12805 [Methylobacter sp.]
MKLSQALYAAYPSNVSFKHGLAVSYSNLFHIHSKLNHSDQAIEHLKHCQKIWSELNTDFPKHVEFKTNLVTIENLLNAQEKPNHN